jgi:hypothetical protein
MRLRLLATLAISLGLLSTTACGGGGGGGGGGSGTSTLSGRIVTRNGSTSNLGGISVTFLRTGQTVTSNANGSFGFGSVPTGTVALKVTDPTLSMATVQTLGNDDPPGDDNGDDGNDDSFDDGDDHDTGDDDFDLVGITNGDQVELHISIRNGVVESLDCARSHAEDRESEVRMTRSVDSDDADVTGEIETESRLDRQRLKIEAEHLTAGRVVKAFVSFAGVEADLGSRTADAFGKVEWDLNTNDGDVLPLGVTTVAELAGADVRVEDAGDATILLVGTVPETPTTTDAGGGSGSHEDGRSREGLTRAAGAVGEAYVELRSRPDQGNRQRFKAEIDHQTVGLVVDVWLEDPANAGTLTKIGSMTVGSEGEGELELDTHEGAGLPYGVTSVQSLVGLQVELRTTADVVLFSGVVPALVTD